MSKTTKFRLSTVVFILFILAIFAFNIYHAVHLTKVCTEETEATVIAVKTKHERENKRNKTYYYPIVSYDIEGQEYKAKAEKTRSRSQYEVGKTVKIMYNPANPKDFYVKGINGSNPAMKLAGEVALTLVFAVLVFAFSIMKVKKKKQTYSLR